MRAELEIKRSRFIALVGRADTEEAARRAVASARSQYSDARHHCSAFIIHMPQAQPVERSSDDGEPSGTAGRPMLDVVRGSGMQDIVAVVVRYFGGIKLGAGGLVHAYSGAVSQALDRVTPTWRRRWERWELAVTHAEAGRVESELRALPAPNVRVVDAHYAQHVTLSLLCRPGGGDELKGYVAAATGGRETPRRVGEAWWDVEASSAGGRESRTL